MKREHLIQRLIDRSEPVIEKYLLGILPRDELPDHCMKWTGARQNNRQNVMVWKGKKLAAHRLMMEIAGDLDPFFRTRNTCGDPTCVNPKHWSSTNPFLADPPMPEEPEEWSLEEVVELLEILVNEKEPKSWSDVRTSPLAEGVPDQLIQDGLRQLGLTQLLPS